MNIIQVYTPAKDSQKKLVEQFYKQLKQTSSNIKNKGSTIIMGDQNGKIGQGHD